MADLIRFSLAMFHGYYDGRWNGADCNPYLGEQRFYYRRGYYRGLAEYCDKYLKVRGE